MQLAELDVFNMRFPLADKVLCELLTHSGRALAAHLRGTRTLSHQLSGGLWLRTGQRGEGRGPRVLGWVPPLLGQGTPPHSLLEGDGSQQAEG